MEIILWRHAEAEDGVPGRVADAARELTPHGRKQARKMADWLLERLPRDCTILVSPAVRTQQTAAELRHPFTTAAKVGTGASAEGVLSAANWDADAPGTVLVVGHQPTLGGVAALLLDGPPEGMSLKKGSIVWIEGRLEGNVLKAALTPALV